METEDENAFATRNQFPYRQKKPTGKCNLQLQTLLASVIARNFLNQSLWYKQGQTRASGTNKDRKVENLICTILRNTQQPIKMLILRIKREI